MFDRLFSFVSVAGRWKERYVGGLGVKGQTLVRLETLGASSRSAGRGITYWCSASCRTNLKKGHPPAAEGRRDIVTPRYLKYV